MPLSPTVPRTILKGPPAPRHTWASHTVRGALGAVLTVPYAVLGAIGGCPGVGFRWACVRMAVRGLGRLPISRVLSLIAAPLDSVRYFEFDFARRCIAEGSPRDYLDVSSPRLLPLDVARRHPALKAVLLNPDRSDLDRTEILIRALGLAGRCSTSDRRIAACGLPDGSFDLITSISVVEHIPADTEAIAAMWRLLRPGGRLILTVPCAAAPAEEWADFNGFGVPEPAADGLFFRQRRYSPACLESRIHPAAGRPARMEVYGETRPGLYDRNVLAKMRDPFYPAWREPWMMSREWRKFDRISDLPGIGVAGMMFVKE